MKPIHITTLLTNIAEWTVYKARYQVITDDVPTRFPCLVSHVVIEDQGVLTMSYPDGPLTLENYDRWLSAKTPVMASDVKTYLEAQGTEESKKLLKKYVPTP